MSHLEAFQLETEADYNEEMTEIEVLQLLENSEIPRNILQDPNNPVQGYTDKEFKKRFRFPKEIFFELLSIVYPEDSDDFRGGRIPNYLSLLCALRYYASNSFQIVSGDLAFFNIHQTTVCRIVARVSRQISSLFHKFVHLTTDEARENITGFCLTKGMPMVIGCIDGTHIKISKPHRNDSEIFRNRKGTFSINCQAVCNPKLQIVDFVGNWPGSAHDSRIFSNSRLSVDLEEGKFADGHLLGDKGYKCTRFLLTPLRNPQTAAEISYNNAHCATRSSIERTFGNLKRRFPCLQSTLRTTLQNSLYTITACVVLYNMLIEASIPLDPEEEQENGELCEEDEEEEEEEDIPLAINQKRQFIIDSYF